MSIWRMTILCGILGAGLAASAEQLKRLDPHGAPTLDLKEKVNLKKQTECTTCHLVTGGTLSTKASAQTSCNNCHAPVPHSGVKEHMGRLYKGEAIDCLSCHSPHRASQVAWQGPTHFFAQPVTPDAPKGFTQSNHAKPMLKRTCTECHKW